MNITVEIVWIGIGLLGQILFSLRFICQWVVSERKKASVVPTVFWYFSMGGGSLLLAYAIYKKDPVFIVGQGVGLLIYLRNIVLISRKTKQRDDNG